MPSARIYPGAPVGVLSSGSPWTISAHGTRVGKKFVGTGKALVGTLEADGVHDADACMLRLLYSTTTSNDNR